MKMNFFSFLIFNLIVKLNKIKCQNNEDVSRVSACINIVDYINNNNNKSGNNNLIRDQILNCYMNINNNLLERIIKDITEGKGIIITEKELDLLTNIKKFHKKNSIKKIKYFSKRLSNTLERIQKINKGIDDYKENEEDYSNIKYNFKYVNYNNNKNNNKNSIIKWIKKIVRIIYIVININKKFIITSLIITYSNKIVNLLFNLFKSDLKFNNKNNNENFNNKNDDIIPNILDYENKFK